MRKTTGMRAWIAAGLLMMTPMVASASQIAYAGPSDREMATPNHLEAQARALFATPARYGEAVRLFVKAADMREVGDPIRVKDLIMASRLTYYRADTERALELMSRAANEALSTGDVLTAAHSFMDGAFLAQEVGHAGVVTELVKKAERLSYSPLIAAADRQEILNRIASSGA